MEITTIGQVALGPFDAVHETPQEYAYGHHGRGALL
jgi:hypothetical protein